jgi:4-hydroxy-3-methylbut-2-enyl diphosphate reductase
MLKVEIDQNSGYCFGVEFAIQMAEDELDSSGRLYCLGDIVHNDMEVRRLNDKGLEIVDRENLKDIKNAKVLIRAHGEPPETYKIALENNLELIDASCPVVLKLQNRVKHSYDKAKSKNGQIVIYGKPGHAEIIGLTGQTGEEAIVITTVEDLDKIDFNRPVTLYSQTTKSTKGFYAIKEEIEKRIKEAHNDTGLSEFDFDANDSICRQVSNREPQLFKFAQNHDVIVFVSGKKSSNGKALYGVCKNVNPESYFIESAEELNPEWFEKANSVGICGATSTPMWLMEDVKKSIEDLSIVEEKV